jgi:hypothetical protein
LNLRAVLPAILLVVSGCTHHYTYLGPWQKVEMPTAIYRLRGEKIGDDFVLSMERHVSGRTLFQREAEYHRSVPLPAMTGAAVAGVAACVYGAFSMSNGHVVIGRDAVAIGLTAPLGLWLLGRGSGTTSLDSAESVAYTEPVPDQDLRITVEGMNTSDVVRTGPTGKVTLDLRRYAGLTSGTALVIGTEWTGPGSAALTYTLPDSAFRRLRGQPGMLVDILVPTRESSDFAGDSVRITGVVWGQTGVVDVTVDGRRATRLRAPRLAAPVWALDTFYFSEVIAVAPGANRVLITATDSGGKRQTRHLVVVGRGHHAPTLPKLFAVLIGVDNQLDPPRQPGAGLAPGAAAIGHAIAEAEAAGGYSGVRLWELTGQAAGQAAIADVLRDSLSTATEEDLVVIYVGMRVLLDTDGQVYLLARDSRRADLFETGIPIDYVTQIVVNLRARAAILVVDMPGDPDATRAALGKLRDAFADANGIAVLAPTAAASTYAPADGASPFSQAVAAGLTGEADVEPLDGTVTLGELVAFVADRTTVGAGRRLRPTLYGRLPSQTPLAPSTRTR